MFYRRHDSVPSVEIDVENEVPQTGEATENVENDIRATSGNADQLDVVTKKYYAAVSFAGSKANEDIDKLEGQQKEPQEEEEQKDEEEQAEEQIAELTGEQTEAKSQTNKSIDSKQKPPSESRS